MELQLNAQPEKKKIKLKSQTLVVVLGALSEVVFFVFGGDINMPHSYRQIAGLYIYIYIYI